VGDVFRLVVVPDEAVDVAQDVIVETDVKEVDPLGVPLLGLGDRSPNETAFLRTPNAGGRRVHAFSCMLTACGYCWFTMDLRSGEFHAER
jgi:hypothetical protein